MSHPRTGRLGNDSISGAGLIMTLYSAQTGVETIGGDRARGPKHVPVLPTCRPIELCESPPSRGADRNMVLHHEGKGRLPPPRPLTTSRPKAREAEMDKDLRRLLTAYCRKARLLARLLTPLSRSGIGSRSPPSRSGD